MKLREIYPFIGVALILTGTYLSCTNKASFGVIMPLLIAGIVLLIIFSKPKIKKDMV
jgi:hypothetical protein